MEYYGFQGATTTVETCNIRWKPDQPVPTYEEALRKTTPEGYTVDQAAIDAYAAKNPNELTISSEGIKKQAENNPRGGTLYFITAHRPKEVKKNFING
jgi:hypothetical protein